MLQRVVTLRKVVHPGIHAATTSVISDTANNAAFSDAAAFSVAQQRRTPQHSHSHDKSVFSDMAKKSAFSDAAAFNDAQKTCTPRHSHSYDKSVFSDTAKKSAFSDAVAFGEARERRAPWHSHSHKSVFSSQRLVTLQRFVTHGKDGHPSIHTATKSPCLLTGEKLSVQ